MSDLLWTRVTEQAVQIERLTTAHQQLVAQAQTALTEQGQKIEALTGEVESLRGRLMNLSSPPEPLANIGQVGQQQ